MTACGRIRSCVPAAIRLRPERRKSSGTLWVILFWACPRVTEDIEHELRIDGNPTDVEEYGAQVSGRGVPARGSAQADGNGNGVRCRVVGEDRGTRLDRHHLPGRVRRLWHGHGRNGGHS